MPKWIKHIHWGKTFGIGVLFTILSTVIRQIEMLWTVKYYTDSVFSVHQPFELFVLSTVINIFTGMALTIIYYYLKEYLPKGYMKRSFFFADVLVATSFLFFTVPVAMLFRMPYALLGYWFLSAFFIIVFSSLIIVKIIGMK